ncbi:MAG: antitoxin of toxin-antitoxin stability system [Lactobacillaceae bacterium]|nr:antitoxin of toxin-antitoxin stability system [Lactobacillaceae bacterium]
MLDIYERGTTMESVKIRKVGSSNVLTVPSSINPKSTEFYVFEGEDGGIVYLPKRKNPFEDQKWADEHENALGDDDFIQFNPLKDEWTE